MWSQRKEFCCDHTSTTNAGRPLDPPLFSDHLRDPVLINPGCQQLGNWQPNSPAAALLVNDLTCPPLIVHPSSLDPHGSQCERVLGHPRARTLLCLAVATHRLLYATGPLRLR